MKSFVPKKGGGLSPMAPFLDLPMSISVQKIYISIQYCFESSEMYLYLNIQGNG